jgi:hypothetical protein
MSVVPLNITLIFHELVVTFFCEAGEADATDLV